VDTVRFWDEEIRSFPHGIQGAAIWVVRREGPETGAPLRMMFGWASGRARNEGLAGRPPLGSLQSAMASGREELVAKEGSTALWVEPLLADHQINGCLGILFDSAEPWREAVFLWGQRLGIRLAPLLGKLQPVPALGPGGADPWQPTLFPLPPLAPSGAGQAAAATNISVTGGQGDLPLPRPVTIPGIPGCIGVSVEMLRLGEKVRDIAASGVNVLLRGESGTGKEIIARAVHRGSERRTGAFIAQNCAALPETLFESELFGHRAGAFTGAAGDKIGLLSAASGGTFFLDEIGDMPLALQIKLLRVMQERRVRRIGELRSRPVDLRFVAATHRDLQQEIADGRFRLDLYYRLKVVSLEIPALRHRPEDVAPLFAFFLKQEGKAEDKYRITEEALAALHSHRWPGNVRELENEVQRLVALYPRTLRIDIAHLSPEIQSRRPGRVQAADLGVLRELAAANELLERYLIRKAIAAAEGRKAAAARRLGLSRQGLYKKIQRYGMTDLIEVRERVSESG